ncbi:unnamed protein product [marine sediment metagenome]|uniref:Uncharacterized protein n=1 Tax=marine sediment metagenome TaxID=412755 RepID=X0Z0S6_9ZZZZ
MGVVYGGGYGRNSIYDEGTVRPSLYSQFKRKWKRYWHGVWQRWTNKEDTFYDRRVTAEKGMCDARFYCKNINKEGCKPLSDKKWIVCEYYSPRVYGVEE